MRIVAIIPARGGSKRLPRKNIYPIWGNPMLSWSIKAAKESKKNSSVCFLFSCVNINKFYKYVRLKIACSFR